MSDRRLETTASVTNNLSGTAGHAVLALKTTNITGCTDATIVDKVGYGATATCPEGGSGHNTAQPTAGQTVTRKPGGCAGSGTDTDLNDADFGAPAAPVFHNAASTPATPTPSALNDGPICEGATLQLTASTIAGATYAWSGPNGFTSSQQNPAITNAAAAASGTYTVTVNGCTSATTTATVIANGAACSDGSLCTTSDTCGGGTCTGTPVVCSALDQCHVAGTCDTGTGQCANPDAPNGSDCSDGKRVHAGGHVPERELASARARWSAPLPIRATSRDPATRRRSLHEPDEGGRRGVQRRQRLHDRRRVHCGRVLGYPGVRSGGRERGVGDEIGRDSRVRLACDRRRDGLRRAARPGEELAGGL